MAAKVPCRARTLQEELKPGISPRKTTAGGANLTSFMQLVPVITRPHRGAIALASAEFAGGRPPQ